MKEGIQILNPFFFFDVWNIENMNKWKIVSIVLIFSLSMHIDGMNNSDKKQQFFNKACEYDPTHSLFRYIQNTYTPLLQQIKEYIYNGAQPNGSFQGTPLLEQLIQKKYMVDKYDEDGYFAIVEYYLQHGADPNMNNSALTYPLQWVDYNQKLSKKIIGLLCKYGANPALQNREGETAFFDYKHLTSYPASSLNEIKRSNAKEKMRYYLLHGCYRKRDESIAFVKKMEKVVVTPSICAFVHKTCRQLPKDLKKQIVFLLDDAIDYQKTVARGLVEREEDQLLKLIDTCPQWTRQSIKELRILVPHRAKHITDLLSIHYQKEGKKVLEIKNKSGMMAKDSSSSLSTLLDPKRFKENFSDVIKEVINQENV